MSTEAYLSLADEARSSLRAMPLAGRGGLTRPNWVALDLMDPATELPTRACITR